MSKFKGLAAKAVITLGVAGVITLGSAAAANAGVVIRDNGHQCAAYWQHADGSIGNWWNGNNTWVAR